jgi:[ribosomal protein S18]-alanine N-acetyltransferase
MMATIDNPMRLARGTSRDLDAVMEVMTGAFGDRYGEAWTRSQCAGILPMTGVTLTVAQHSESGAVVGFSLIRSIADESELLLLAVTPERQGRGIGRALLEQFIDRARDDGASRVHLEVREGNPAIAMYRAAGFMPVGRRRKYYHGSGGEQFDALTFARDL